jgi:RHS repeat-associated protein
VYGFNGKELDKETSSTTTYDYGFRIYSPALGKFLSTDPLFKSYPYYSPYQFAGNMPIWAIDIDGLEPVTVHALTPSNLRPKLRPTEWYEVMTKGGGHFTDETSFAAAAKYNTANNNPSAYQKIENRHTWYNWAAKQQKNNYWFAAASDVTSYTMVGAADMTNLWFMNDAEEDILRGANKFLLAENFKNFWDYALGKGPVKWKGKSYSKLSGAALDNQMVVIEMTTLQGYLADYKKSYISEHGQKAWDKLNKGLNKLFTNKFLNEATPASNQYAQREFTKKYGENVQFDFMNLEHRIFQGQKMAEYLRNEKEKKEEKKP